MDLLDMQHKINPSHDGMFRRMLGVNETPEPVLRRYFAVKKYLDKIDSPVPPTELLRIAIDVGFDLDSGRFIEGAKPPCGIDDGFLVKPETDPPKQDKVVFDPKSNTFTPEEVDRFNKAEDGDVVPVSDPTAVMPPEDPDALTDEKVAEMEEEAEAEKAEQEANGILSAGTDCKIMYDGQIVDGVVEDYDVLSETYAVKVETDDGDVTVDDLTIDDIEV